MVHSLGAWFASTFHAFLQGLDTRKDRLYPVSRDTKSNSENQMNTIPLHANNKLLYSCHFGALRPLRV
jgi:hypothetical protein